MSFEAKDIVPVEYQSIFTVLSPIEKMGILKIVKKEFEEIEDKYIRLFKSLEEYLTRYKDEDISELTFIMSGQIAHDLQKKEFIDRMLDIYPKSPELQYFKTLQQVDKGQFENIDELIEKIRLADEERNRIFTRLVSANRLAAIILDLQSFSLEMTYYNAKEDYSEIEKLYEKTEQIWKETLKWTKDKPILFLQEIIVRLITQYTQYLLSAKNLDTALNYFEDPEIQEILNLVESNITKANILHVGATLYFNVGQPHKAIKQMEEAINIIEKVHGRKEWKATVYHSYAYMLNLIDKDKCIEAFEKCYQLAKVTQDYQLITTTLGNLIGLYTEMNDKKKAKELLDKLVTLLETSDDLITPFRAYAVSTNALMLEQDNLAKKYLKKLEEKVEKSPTNQNKAILANAKMSYFTTAEINSNKILKWGTEALYHLNKQKDYLNILATLFNLIIIELEFYNITERKQFLNSAKKRLNELVTLTGVLDLPTWLADKNVAQACMEILSKNYDYAESIIKDIPESEEITIQKKKAIIQYLLDIVIQKRNKERKKAKGEFEEKPEIVLTNPPPLLVMKEIADDQDAMDQLLIYFARKSLQNLVSITTSFDPEQTDIKLILLINEAGLPIYTKVFDEQKINKNLISNFISAIDSFGKRLFGTAEPYFSFQRGKNTILYQSVTPKLNLAILVSKENYDAVMKLTQINKEISAYLKEHNIDLSKTLDEKEPFHQWLEEEFTKLNI